MDTAQETAQEWGEFGLNMILEAGILSFLGKMLLAIIVFVVLLMIAKAVSASVRNRVVENTVVDDDEYSKKVWDLIGTLTYYTWVVLSMFIGLQIVWFDIWILLGWISVGLWFAFKEVLGNLLAWVLILTTKEFKLGDNIEIQGSNNYFWTIEEITMRYTVLRGLDLRRTVMPNLELITNPVMTFTSEDLLKLNTTVIVWYWTDLDRASQIALEAVNNLEVVKNKDENKTMITNLKDSDFGTNWVEIKVIFHVEPWGDVKGPWWPISQANKAIYNAFIENWINIPYPHTSITVDKNDKNLLGSAMYVINKSRNS